MNKKYTLSELLSQCCSASVGITEEQQAWLDMRPIGREVISIREETTDTLSFRPTDQDLKQTSFRPVSDVELAEFEPNDISSAAPPGISFR